MHFNLALISSFLSVSAVLVDRTLALERRSVLLERVELDTPSNQPTLSNRFYKAGGVVALDSGTVQNISTYFYVPHMENIAGAGVTISVDIGHDHACTSILSAGVKIHVDKTGPTYTGYYHVRSSDGHINKRSDFPVSPNDFMNIVLGISNETSATVEVNSSHKNKVYRDTIGIDGSFCRQSAQWVTNVNPHWTLPSSYGVVTFTMPTVYDESGNIYGPRKAEIFNMIDSERHVLTNTTFNDVSILIAPPPKE